MDWIKKIFLIYILIYFLLFQSISFAQQILEDLKLIPEPIAGGQAETGTAKKGLSYFWYNPASISGINRFAINFSHFEWISDTRINSLSFGIPIVHNKLSIIGALRANYLLNFQGYEESYIGNIDSYLIEFIFGIGSEIFKFKHKTFKRICIGANIRDINQKIYNLSLKDKFLGDIGVLVDLRFLPLKYYKKNESNFTIGISVNHINFEKDYNIPFIYRIGFNYKLFNFLDLSTDFVYDKKSFVRVSNKKIYVAIYNGLQFCIKNIISLRCGYKFLDENTSQGITGGIGINYNFRNNGVSINYSIEPTERWGLCHKIGIIWYLAEKSERIIPIDSTIKTEPKLFIPDLKRKNKVKIYVDIDKEDKKRIKQYRLIILESSNKKLFKEIKGKKLPNIIKWDGKNKKGKMCKFGEEYFFRLELVETNNHKWYSNEDKVKIGLKLDARKKKIYFSMAASVLFDYKSAKLKSEAKETLNQIADFLKREPKYNIIVSGYTDNIGSDEYNLKLSKDRALNVKKYLVKRGISQKRIKAFGYGKKHPVASNKTAEGRAKNRRVEFLLIRAGDGAKLY